MREDECKIMYTEYQGWSFTCEAGVSRVREDECKIMYREYQGVSRVRGGGMNVK